MKKFEQIKNNEDLGFLCIEWNNMDPISLFGHLTTSDSFKSLKIRVIPCNQHAYYDEKNQFTIDEKCNSDLKE